MKKIILLTLLAVITFSAFAQKLEQDEVDEFKDIIKRKTSWEHLLYTTKSPVCYYRIISYNNTMYFQLRVQGTTAVTIPEKSELILKFDDETTITLFADALVFSSVGGGSINLVGSATFGFVEDYKITDENLDMLLFKKAIKARVYTRDSYFENNIKPKDAEKIPIAVKLIWDKVKTDS